jgi:glycosyltransferase involved in cell wall biosynthesis
MKELPLVSVCIPAYNVERFIKDTLESVFLQTYPNLEIIVSDDCSTDKTPEIVSSYASKGVRLIRTPRNLGRYGNCNEVIRASSGKYVLKLDADDLVAPEHIAEQVAVLEANPQVTFAHCACRLIDVDGKLIGYERSVQGSFIRTGIEEWPRYVFGPRAVNIVTIRRSAYDQTGGYDERYLYSGDWAMHRALLKLGSVFYNDKVLASYRVHDIGKQGVRLLQAKEHLMQLQDMEIGWPDGVDNKEYLLKRARYQMGIRAVYSSVYVLPDEQDAILRSLPEYGNYFLVRFLSFIIRRGGSVFIRLYYKAWLLARQIVKRFLYKNEIVVLEQ